MWQPLRAQEEITDWYCQAFRVHEEASDYCQSSCCSCIELQAWIPFTRIAGEFLTWQISVNKVSTNFLLLGKNSAIPKRTVNCVYIQLVSWEVSALILLSQLVTYCNTHSSTWGECSQSVLKQLWWSPFLQPLQERRWCPVAQCALTRIRTQTSEVQRC